MAAEDKVSFTKGFWLYVIPCIITVVIIVLTAIHHGLQADIVTPIVVLDILFWVVLLAMHYTRLFSRAHLYLWYSWLNWLPSHWSLLPLKLIFHLILSFLVLTPDFYKLMPEKHSPFWKTEGVQASWLGRFARLPRDKD